MNNSLTLQKKMNKLLRSADKINGNNNVFFSLLIMQVERLTEDARSMALGTYMISTLKELSVVVDMITSQNRVNKIDIQLVPGLGQKSLVEHPLLHHLLSKILHSNFKKINAIFISHDIICLAIQGPSFQLAKEIAKAGAQVEIYEMLAENHKDFCEGVYFKSNNKILYTIALQTTEGDSQSPLKLDVPINQPKTVSNIIRSGNLNSVRVKKV